MYALPRRALTQPLQEVRRASTASPAEFEVTQQRVHTYTHTCIHAYECVHTGMHYEVSMTTFSKNLDPLLATLSKECGFLLRQHNARQSQACVYTHIEDTHT